MLFLIYAIRNFHMRWAGIGIWGFFIPAYLHTYILDYSIRRFRSPKVNSFKTSDVERCCIFLYSMLIHCGLCPHTTYLSGLGSKDLVLRRRVVNVYADIA